MDFNCLRGAYWERQIARVERVREQISSRLSIAHGRTIPDAEDLSIGKGRRLKAAIMFLDISGFTSRPSESEEEQTNQLAALNLFFSELIKIAEDYSGTVEKNTGDGLMVYFEDGGSDPPENGSHRSVACAMTMFAASEALINPILLRSGIAPILFRICIDHGYITIAKMGAARHFSAIVAIGTTANLASKMLSIAKSGELLIGANVRSELPCQWQDRWTTMHTYKSGWVFKSTKEPYSYYLFNGRWARVFE